MNTVKKNNLLNNPNMVIYLDLDDCLCDFNGGFQNLVNYKYKTSKEYEDRFGIDNFNKLIESAGINFWSKNMKWCCDGIELFNYIKKYKPVILTKPMNFDACLEGKELWIKSNLPTNIRYIIDGDKSKYADKDSLLIDDLESNVDSFRSSGGFAILHKSAIETIKILKSQYLL
jgi:hypothetical protein